MTYPIELSFNTSLSLPTKVFVRHFILDCVTAFFASNSFEPPLCLLLLFENRRFYKLDCFAPLSSISL
ncbi:hypothetical protein CW304_11885 [Bacillus sp. UFRGS-B20]|nr:hypothetical protein CW304_11885 [Bacillus sp. UFRGS-B20]